MTTIDWQIEAYTPKFRPQVLDLMQLVHGHVTRPEEFIWWFENNPVGKINIYLAVYKNEVIGISCHNTFMIHLNGEDVIVSFPLNVLTHPDYRGKGIFTRLEQANEQHSEDAGYPLMLSFPNLASVFIFLNKLGWSAIETNPLFFRPLNIRHLLKRLKYLGWLSPLGALVNPLFQRSAKLESIGLKTTRIFEFGPWVDEIFDANISFLQYCFTKRKEYLNWRFLRDPGEKYEAYQITDGENNIIGFIVTGVIVKKDIKIGFVANGLMKPVFHKYFLRIANSFISRFKELDVDLLLAWPDNRIVPRTSLYKSGYFPTFKKFFFIYKYQNLKNPNPEMESFKNWFIQLGDLDFF